ncbi:unnamed protein product [Closterium sp. Naga37s-1]|nr:unnamed protein product [Closterium sp. Naga37s-1]
MARRKPSEQPLDDGSRRVRTRSVSRGVAGSRATLPTAPFQEAADDTGDAERTPRNAPVLTALNGDEFDRTDGDERPDEPAERSIPRGLEDRTADDAADAIIGDNAAAGTDSGQVGADSENVGGGGASMDAGDVARRRFLSIARQRAAHFAHFDDSSRLTSARRTGARETSPVAGAPPPSASAEAAATAGQGGGRGGSGGGQARGAGAAEQWPGPFATARQLVRGRAAAAAARQAQGGGGARTGESAGERVGRGSIAQGSEAGGEVGGGAGTTGTGASTVPAGVAVSWTPKSQRNTGGGGRDERSGGGGGLGPRSLYSLCLDMVSAHIEALESLEGVPDGVRRDLSACLSAQRRLDGPALLLLVGGVAAELAVADCSLVGEADLHRALLTCHPAKLELVDLSMCGRSLSDTCFTTTLLRAPASLPALRSLSLQGAYRLSDTSLPPLALSAPSLAHLSLLHCPLLSAPAVSTLLSSLASSLKTLRLDGCTQLSAHALLPGLRALTGLTCLSLAGVPSVTDAVLADLLPAVGGHLRDLSLAHCEVVTDESMAAAAVHAPSLTALDLSHLPLLSDDSLHSLCSAQLKLRSLNLTRTNFSDSALASLVQSSGAALHTLSVNAVYECSKQQAPSSSLSPARPTISQTPAIALSGAHDPPRPCSRSPSSHNALPPLSPSHRHRTGCWSL